MSDGKNNIFIGHYAGHQASGSHSTFIGVSAKDCPTEGVVISDGGCGYAETITKKPTPKWFNIYVSVMKFINRMIAN